MSVVITRFPYNGTSKSNVYNVTNGAHRSYITFRAFAKSLNHCVKGHKFQDYWVRGALGPGTDKDGIEHPIYRKDSSLETSALLVLDGDEGKDGQPLDSIDNLMAILDTADLEYCIYTSHSHTAEKTKFRCIIPMAEPMTKEEFKPLMMAFVNVLNNEGYNIKWNKEMGAWTQPWFYPTRDDPDDGLFRHEYRVSTDDHPRFALLKESLVENIPPNEPASQVVGSDVVTDVVGNSDLENIILNQLNGLHGAMNNIIFQLAMDNPTRRSDAADSYIRKLFDEVPEGLRNDRYHQRMREIPASIKGAIARIEAGETSYENEEIDDYGLTYVAPTNNDIPRPPGLLGELVDGALAQADYPHEATAFVSAIGLVAGIAGRKFNVASGRGLALNMYMMLAADTGAGKNSIKNFITDNIPSPAGEDSESLPSFIGPSTFTGGTALIKNHLTPARCMISVMTEMGYVLASETGDKAGKRRVMLDLYTSSGHRDVLHGSAFSSADNEVKSIRSPCYSVIGESTPEKLLSSLINNDSISDGWLPRFSVFRILNPTVESSDEWIPLSDTLKQRIEYLAELCSRDQALAGFECHLIDHYDRKDMKDHQNYWRKQMVDLAGIDNIKSAMASRLHVKALKYAGLATVFNKSKGSDGCVLIESAEWLWAKDMIQYEWNTMNNFFQGSFSASPFDDAASRIIGKYILIALDEKNGRKLNKKMYDSGDPIMRKEHVVSLYHLRMCTSGQLKNFNKDYRDGFDIVLEYMIKEKYVVREEEYHNRYNMGKKGKTILRVKQSFYNRLNV